MGLAASQARFLGITARKSNTEYEGQQVNQQRTVLAQEVNNLFARLMQLDKPIEPVKSDFYYTDYTFEIESGRTNYNGNYSLNSFRKVEDDKYELKVTRTYTDEIAQATLHNSARNTIKKNEDGTYTYVDEQGGEHVLSKMSEDDSKSIIEKINKYCTNTPKIDSKFLYEYSEGGVAHYFDPSVIEVDDFDIETTNLYSYELTNKEFKEDLTLYAKQIEFDTYNNIKDIKGIYAMQDDDGEMKPIDITSQADIVVTKGFDEAKMDEAMRNYTIEIDEYNKEYARINAETESLQQEDKVLEMRLDQLDTEQEELSQELEAIKQVITKNIENTFKTFA